MICPRAFFRPEEFAVALAEDKAFREATEAAMRAQATVPGSCLLCGRDTNFRVDAGANFGPDYPNLREGLVCECGGKNRDRLMARGSRSYLEKAESVVFFGAFSGWADWARRAFPGKITFCEYFADVETRGQTRTVQGLDIRNEDMTAITFAEETADLVLHQDVLEHIPNYRRALSETHSLLKPGGTLVFTAPFFHERRQTNVRAAVMPDGRIEHYAPEERHGDPLNPEGILAFYNFGWTLLDDMRAAGFEDVRLEYFYQPEQGIVSTGCPFPVANMMPVYLVGTKPLAGARD
jgi:SAM-dependent methyltransferase